MKTFLTKHPNTFRWATLGAAVAMFVWIAAQFYLPGQGFTYLIMFGGRQSQHYLPELRALNHYEPADSFGYDAQFYAQIAMHPHLRDPALRAAVDSLPYRARRILFCWTAYILSGGNPARALQIYAVQNIVAWLLLAVLLLRWLPPATWGNVGRWLLTLFSYGFCLSIRGALVDGPSLLLIAGALALAETGRGITASVVLGLGGLGKETNLLAVIALPWPRGWNFREWLGWCARCTIAVLPLALWLLCLRVWLGEGGDLGARNFAAPFFGYIHQWRAIALQWHRQGLVSLATGGALMLVALLAQWLFFILRPQWRNSWWRLGVAYALLMSVLGDAVWEGYPGAAVRVLLPMTLAFNLLVPRGRRWIALLVLGNLPILLSADALKPPGRESARVEGPREWRILEPSGQTVDATFADGEWDIPERSFFDYWRWSFGPADVSFQNPNAFALRADIYFNIKSDDRREVTLRSGSMVLWHGNTSPKLTAVLVRSVRLEPGETRWHFETDRPPAQLAGTPRAFSVRSLRVVLRGRAEAPTAP